MALIFREARREDVPAIVAMLADDTLGKAREGADMQPYLTAFETLQSNPTQMIIVGDEAGELVASYQLALLDGLSRKGARRALVEAVRVVADRRSQGLGAALMADCEARARAAGAQVLQLTTDKSRLRAHAFYERLGFQASHIGYKKQL